MSSYKKISKFAQILKCGKLVIKPPAWIKSFVMDIRASSKLVQMLIANKQKTELFDGLLISQYMFTYRRK